MIRPVNQTEPYMIVEYGTSERYFLSWGCMELRFLWDNLATNSQSRHSLNFLGKERVVDWFAHVLWLYCVLCFRFLAFNGLPSSDRDKVVIQVVDELLVFADFNRKVKVPLAGMDVDSIEKKVCICQPSD